MKLGIYAVRDRAADAFLPVFVMVTDSMAIRDFGAACEKPEHQFNKFKQDYGLYKLGEFFDDSGRVVGYKEPVFLMGADGVPGASVTANIDLFNMDVTAREV